MTTCLYKYRDNYIWYTATILCLNYVGIFLHVFKIKLCDVISFVFQQLDQGISKRITEYKEHLPTPLT